MSSITDLIKKTTLANICATVTIFGLLIYAITYKDEKIVYALLGAAVTYLYKKK